MASSFKHHDEIVEKHIIEPRRSQVMDANECLEQMMSSPLYQLGVEEDDEDGGNEDLREYLEDLKKDKEAWGLAGDFEKEEFEIEAKAKWWQRGKGKDKMKEEGVEVESAEEFWEKKRGGFKGVWRDGGDEKGV